MKKIKSSSILLFLVFASIIVIFFIFYSLFSRNSESSAVQQLTLSNNLTFKNLNTYFDNIESSLLVIDRVEVTRDMFTDACISDDSLGCDDYLEYFDILDDAEKNINGFDFFDLSGNRFLSTDNTREVPVFLNTFFTRSVEGRNPFLESNKTHRSQAYNQIYFTDFLEENNTPYMFAVLVVHDANGTKMGYVVAHLNIDVLDAIFKSQTDMNSSQETYLVGSDLVMRTNSLFADESTRFSQIVKNEVTERCFNNTQSGGQTFSESYSGNEVLSLYEYIPRFDWCLISEIDKEEITQIRNIVIKILSLLALLFIGTLMMFFEKITENTNFLKKKQQDLTNALFEKEKFKKALDAASDNIFILDIHGQVIYMNRAVSSHTGFMPKEALGQKIQELWWSGVEQQTRDDIFEQTFSRKISGSWEIKSIKKTGVSYNAEVFITPVISEGNFLFALVIEHDIQKRKELESLKDEFIAIASHELRTPMTIIRGYVSLLLDNLLGDLNEKQKELLKKIDTSSEKLIALVTDMLDMSKLEKMEEREITKKYFDVRDVIEEVSDGFTAILKEKGLRYNVSYDTYTKIDSDSDLLKQVFVNLIGNAVKFTERGGSITLRVKPSHDDSFIRFEVVDTGIGIPEAYRSMIFKKFSQVENYLTKKSEGTGLGLPICKKIVTMFGGFIDFKNNQDRGTTFYFEIPRD